MDLEETTRSKVIPGEPIGRTRQCVNFAPNRQAYRTDITSFIVYSASSVQGGTMERRVYGRLPVLRSQAAMLLRAGSDLSIQERK